MKNGHEIRSFLKILYPSFHDLLFSGAVIPKLRTRNTSIGDATVRIVIGQMLSRKAAASIYSRLQTKAKEEGLSETWELRDAHLAACGVSSRKIKTIKCFRKNYIRDPGYFQNWKNLSPNSLLQEVNKQWGMSDWTSNMLSIFHFGHEDVFPENDGSIKRALNLAHELINRSAKLDPKAAKPYRSYLALYLWQALDHGILKSQKTR